MPGKLVMPLIVVLLMMSLSSGQAQEVPHFEVASVKVHKGQGGNVTRQVGPATITYLNVSLRELIEQAYGVKHYQFSGPAWIMDFGSQERYDLIGKASLPTSQHELWTMAIRLLQERFKLAIHQEKREIPVYALVVSVGDGGDQSKELAASGATSYKNYTMDAFADDLSTVLQRFQRPVLNRTSLEGRYSFTTNLLNLPAGLSPAEYRNAIIHAVASLDDSPVFTNLKDLGLSIESAKAQIDMIVIDHAAKVPEEN
jgi:uncharacterized protein (TIGR03435 family)